MQILKEKNKRINNSRYIRRDSHYQDVSLDSRVAMSKACKAALSTPTQSSKEEAINALNDASRKQMEEFCGKYPPNFARYQYPHLVTINGTKLSWNKESLFILFNDYTGYGGGHSIQYNTFLSFMLTETLAYGNIDISNLDRIEMEEEADKVLERINNQIN